MLFKGMGTTGFSGGTGRWWLAGIVSAVGMVVLGSPARADFKVRSPIVDFREFEFEHNGSVTFDKAKSGKNNNQSYTNEIEVGVTPFWLLGLEGEWAAPSGENLKREATTLESMFQLTPQGEWWADLGFFVEYSRAASRRDPDSLTFGPVVQKELPGIVPLGTLHTLNLFFDKQIGPNRTDDTGFTYAWQSRLLVHPLFDPGFEMFGEIGNIEAPGKLADQQHRIGPMFAGFIGLQPYGKIKYELGYLFGLTRATEAGALRWRFEYEVPF